MNKRKRKYWANGTVWALFLVGFIYALVDPTDRQTHLRACIYGAGLLVSGFGLVLQLKRRV
jgi:hypothetical protein